MTPFHPGILPTLDEREPSVLSPLEVSTEHCLANVLKNQSLNECLWYKRYSSSLSRCRFLEEWWKFFTSSYCSPRGHMWRLIPKSILQRLWDEPGYQLSVPSIITEKTKMMNKNTTLSFLGNHKFSFITTSMYLWSTADEIFAALSVVLQLFTQIP